MKIIKCGDHTFLESVEDCSSWHLEPSSYFCLDECDLWSGGTSELSRLYLGPSSVPAQRRDISTMSQKCHAAVCRSTRSLLPKAFSPHLKWNSPAWKITRRPPMSPCPSLICWLGPDNYPRGMHKTPFVSAPDAKMTVWHFSPCLAANDDGHRMALNATVAFMLGRSLFMGIEICILPSSLDWHSIHSGIEPKVMTAPVLYFSWFSVCNFMQRSNWKGIWITTKSENEIKVREVSAGWSPRTACHKAKALVM